MAWPLDSLYIYIFDGFLMDTDGGMVMSWCWVRGGEVYGPLFKPRTCMHHHFPIGISFT